MKGRGDTTTKIGPEHVGMVKTRCGAIVVETCTAESVRVLLMGIALFEFSSHSSNLSVTRPMMAD